MQSSIMRLVGFGLLLIVLAIGLWLFFPQAVEDRLSRPNIGRLDDIQDLFPTTEDKVNVLATTIMAQTTNHIKKLSARAAHNRTFENTFEYLDQIVEHFMIAQTSLYVLSMTSSEGALKQAAYAALTQLQEFSVDLLSHNRELYRACHEYVKGLSPHDREKLTSQQRYFIDETMREFHRNGLELPPECQERVRLLTKEIAQLTLEYEAAYSKDIAEISVSKEELKGLDESFIRSLKQGADGQSLIPLSYDKFYTVLEQSEDQQTRKKVYQAFMKRGYPQNEKCLEKILRCSHDLAVLLGYKSFAHLSLDGQMAGSPEKVESFLNEVRKRSTPLGMAEFARMRADLPPDIHLKQGKFQPWDLLYVYHYHKKKYLKINEEEIAHYFPLQKTLTALFKVYEDFFGICFVPIKKAIFWHEEVQPLAVYAQGKYIGMILLDLFPRPGKFSHAGHISIVPSVRDAGKLLPAVVLVCMNVSRDHPDRPAILRRQEVLTFFHECGHALHALLGATPFATLSGTSVKADFVEMPSQMLEEWMWDPAILRSISSHVDTGMPLSDELIDKILKIKNFEAGDNLWRQLFLAELSLNLYLVPGTPSLAQTWKRYHERFRPNLGFDDSNKGYCSFPHITGYGPRYYGYLWSKVYALDLFSHIKPYGLRNPAIGSLYVEKVLSKGGSQDPYELITSFLGREPSTDAFFKDFGLE